ncbi:hypothetical protein M422DRAFT_272704 [Sphaerobolus stellatus SS14]|uniref:Uncharacterized protein n=1 Tax=Sphaerobolus stellatus (strain SS14) TaxID=990650 RepID=A0A0C9ULB8_SPHS4|nr:hypothetical protein M422DRAFT_272704 [Sphaerobolus stellatus SS14]
MTSAVPTFGGGMKENGWDWLKEIKAHFADARIMMDQARCEYFELKLRSDAARRFEELPEAICTDWKALEGEWKRLYPVRNAYLNTTKDINEFYDLRITDKDLASRTAESSDGDPEWAIAQFTEKLHYLGARVNDASETSKGRHVFRHLPPLIRDRLPAYGARAAHGYHPRDLYRGNTRGWYPCAALYGAQGPELERLCTDLAALDHTYIAKLATQQERIQSQLDSIARFSAQSGNRPQRAIFQPRQPQANFSTFSSNTFNTAQTNSSTPAQFGAQTELQNRTNRPLRTLTSNADFSNTALPNEMTKSATSQVNSSFDTSPEGI